MRFNMLVVAAVLPAALLSGRIQAAEPAPVVIRLQTEDIEVSPDGLFTRTLHREIRASNAAAAMEVGQQSLSFSESMENFEVVEAYTEKVNGEHVPVGPAAIYTQQPQGSPQYPLFDDIRQKVIVFPSVGAGDSVVYTVRWRATKAFIPNQFTYGEFFPTAMAYEDARISLSAPKSFPLQIDTHDLEFAKSEAGDKAVYTWHRRAPAPSLDDPPRVSPLDSQPRFFVSSFKNYDEFGHAFAALFAAKEIVTPKIQELADRLTSGIADRQRQAQAVYDWVSRNIRYVAIDIGNGGIIPHDADSVLANAYGDCKDHAVLFATLLKAKGIAAETVIINLGNAYTLANVPVLTPLNHAITWLPEFKLYADTTAGTAPFGLLPFSEYGKPVIHAVAAGPARHQVPVLTSGLADEQTKISIQIGADGKLTGSQTVSATGPFAVDLRRLALAVQSAGAERFAASALQRQGLVGTGDFSITPPENLSNDYSLAATFSYGPKPEYLQGIRFAMPHGMLLADAAGDYLMGPLFDEKIKPSDATVCFSGRSVEEITLEAPEDRQFTKPPTDISIRTRTLQFSAKWSVLSKNKITLRREFVTTIDRPLCEGATRTETAEKLAQIRRHYLFDQISIVRPKPTAPEVAADVMNLLNAAERAFDNHDWNSLIQITSAALPLIAPQDITSLVAVFHDRGLAYSQLGNYTKAISDFSEALRLDPKQYESLVQRGQAYSRLGRWSHAESDFKAAIAANPDNAVAYTLRAESSTARLLYRRALEDCTKALQLGNRDAFCHEISSRADYILADYKASIEQATEALRISADDRFALFDRAASYLATGQFREAETDLDKALKLQANWVDALFARGVAREKLGNDAAAVADFDAAKKLESYVAYRMAGYGISTSTFKPGPDDIAACRTSPDVIQAVTYCNRTLAIPDLSADDKAVAHENLGRSYMAGGENEEALAELNTADKLKPRDIDILTARAVVHGNRGDRDEARADFDAAAQINPDSPRLLLERARFDVRNGTLDAVVLDVEQLMKKSGDAPDPYMIRATAYVNNDQFDKAVTDSDTAVRLRPNRATYTARCAVLTYAGRLTAAMSDCEKSLIEAPNDAGALAVQGMIYLKLGQDAKAAENFRRAIVISPDSAIAWYGQGVLKLKSGDKTGEEDMAEAALLDADLVARLQRWGFKP